jgi:hypothetical protein
VTLRIFVVRVNAFDTSCVILVGTRRSEKGKSVQTRVIGLPKIIVAGALVLSVSILSPWFSNNVAGADTSALGTSCSSNMLEVSVIPGLAGAGHSSSVILVRNVGPNMCRIGGYPAVRLLGGNEIGRTLAIETPTGFSGGLPAGESIPRIDLHKGEVASAVMEGTDFPVGNAATCPSYPSYTITLPGSHYAIRVTRAIENCSGLYVHPLVIGFNGTFPSGEVVGLAPACRSSGRAGSSIGPFVQIEALSGSHLAGEITIVASSESKERFEMVLKPGRYYIQSQHDRTSVHVNVHAGEAVNLGSYGSCVEMSNVPATTHVPGATPQITSTTT